MLRVIAQASSISLDQFGSDFLLSVFLYPYIRTVFVSGCAGVLTLVFTRLSSLMTFFNTMTRQVLIKIVAIATMLYAAR